MTILDRIRARFSADVTPEDEIRAAEKRSRRQQDEAKRLAAIHKRERELNHFAERIRAELQGRHP